VPDEIQRDSSAPEILASLRQLQAELAATRVDIRTLAERAPAGGAGAASPAEQSSIAEEVQRTTNALNEEASARERNIALARDELAAQRAITAEVERTFASFAKLSETRVAAPSTAPAIAQAEAAAATRERLRTTSAPAIIPAPSFGATEEGAAKAVPALGTYGEELANVSARQAEFQSMQLQGGAANAQFVSSLLRGDVTLGEFGAQLTTTAGKFAQWTAAAGGVFAVIGIFDEVYKGARDSSSGVSQLQRSIDNLNTEKAQSDFRRLAEELNIPIKDASDAVFQFSRTFPNLQAAVAGASVGLRAQKVDNVELATSVRALTAVHQQFGVGANELSGVFDLLDEGQRRYNARVGDTLAVLGKSSAAVKDAGGSLLQLVQLATYASRVTGQPGNQIGTAFYRAASNTVQNPANQSVIKSLGLDPNQAANDFTEFLITAIRKSASESQQWKRELAIAIGGKQQGGKVFEPLLSGNANLLNEIIGNVTPDKARGSTQDELGRILERNDERIKALKYDLEQMGAELQRAGATAGLGILLLTVTDTLKVTNQLLDAFNILPHPVKELIVVLLEAKLALAGLRATALGTGLANATGLSFLAPSPEQQARRAERAAQQSALTSVTGLQGSTLVREQQLRTQAAINEQEIAILRTEQAAVTTTEERAALKARVEQLEAESLALSQEGNLLLTEQAAQQEVANGLQARINALRAGEAPALGFFPGAAAGGAAAAAGSEAAAAGGASTAEIAGLVGGGLFAKLASLPEVLSSTLSIAMRGLGVGILADVGAQITGQIVGGGLGKKIAGIGGDIAIGAGAGSVIPGVGTVVGGLGGALFGLVKEDLKGEKQRPDPNVEGFNHAVANFESKLGPVILRAQAGEISPQALQQAQDALRSMVSDPAFDRFRGQLKALQTQLEEVSKGSSDAAQSLARAKLFNTYEGIAGENPKQAKEHIATLGLKASVTGANPKALGTITDELDSLAGQFGGGENKEGLEALQEAETKLLEASKKNAQDLADKAKFDPNLSSKEGDYKASIGALDSALHGVQAGYEHLKAELGKEQDELARLEAERDQENAHPTGKLSQAKIDKREKDITELRKQIEGNKSQLGQVKKATEYESNQLKAAREQAAEAAFSDISNTIDASTNLAEAQTTNKSVQLHETLHADNLKLKLAAELFGKNSIQYKRALTEVLKEQQAIVEQAVTDIDVQGKLEASEIPGNGPDSDIARAQLGVNTLRQELGTLVAGKAEPNKIKQVQTQINEAERALAKSVTDRAKTVNDALAQIHEAQVVDPLAKARIGLGAAERDERGLTGTELLQQKAVVAQKRADVYQQATDEKLAQLKYEHDVEKLSDNAYISSLQSLINTRKLANSTKRQLLGEIHQLENAGASGLELNVGSIKLPSVYEVRRAIAGGSRASLGSQLSVSTTNEFKITVSKGGDETKVFAAIDKALNTSTSAAMRAAGKA
jgi:hypothetical protein